MQTRTLENICALALIGAFFLPWFQAFGVNVSGFQLQELGNSYTVV